MQRFNCFNLIHKALRAMLYDAALTVQQTYYADVQEADIAFDKIMHVLESFDQHAHHEDHHVLPAVQQFNPGLVEEFESEHVKDLQLSNSLRRLLQMYHALNTTAERIECGSAIAKAFVEFMIFNLEHMAREEQLVMPALWAHYTDAEIMAINQRIIAGIPADEMMEIAVWMLRGINNQDAINWMLGVKHNAPAAMYNQLVAAAERELPANRFDAIILKVATTAMIA